MSANRKRFSPAVHMGVTADDSVDVKPGASESEPTQAPAEASPPARTRGRTSVRTDVRPQAREDTPADGGAQVDVSSLTLASLREHLASTQRRYAAMRRGIDTAARVVREAELRAASARGELGAAMQAGEAIMSREEVEAIVLAAGVSSETLKTI